MEKTTTKSSDNFLDVNETIISSKFHFVKDDVADELNLIFGDQNPVNSIDDISMKVMNDHSNTNTTNDAMEPKLMYNIITPMPGCCIKAFTVIDNEKIFINVCQSDGMPEPKDISMVELTEILQSDDSNAFRIPMSIAEFRNTQDKSGRIAQVTDIVVHPNFFKKFQEIEFFKNFFLTVIFEAIDLKYNIMLNTETWIILKNRKFMGKLMQHRIENRDYKCVQDFYDDGCDKSQKSLIEELNPLGNNKLTTTTVITTSTLTPSSSLSSASTTSTSTSKSTSSSSISSSSHSAPKRPEYRLILDTSTNETETADNIIGEFYLPDCNSVNEVVLSVAADRITIESRKRGYLLDDYFPYFIEPQQTIAEFDRMRKVLTVKMPIICK